MPSTDEFSPDSHIVEAVFREAIQPIVDKCEQTFGERLTADVYLSMQGERLLAIAAQPGSFAKGEIRIIFRTTINPSRIRFCVEAIYTGLAANTTGFSGFSVRGDLKIADNGKVAVAPKSGAYRNNVWNFLGWG